LELEPGLLACSAGPAAAPPFRECCTDSFLSGVPGDVLLPPPPGGRDSELPMSPPFRPWQRST
jgi:hypothetical protein